MTLKNLSVNKHRSISLYSAYNEKTSFTISNLFGIMIVGMVNDMYAESSNDDYKYPEVATQEDFDRF